MAVNTADAGLLVDVRLQLMVFNTVRAGVGVVVAIRGPEFTGEIPFVATVIVTADPVAEVAVQTLVICGITAELMALQSVVVKGEMAGGAAGAVFCLWVWAALIVEMAAQAASPQEVVGQCEDRGRRFCYRDLCERGQGAVAPKAVLTRLTARLMVKWLAVAAFAVCCGWHWPQVCCML